MYIPEIGKQASEELQNKWFLDYKKSSNQLYNNLYIDDYKIVIKMAISHNCDFNKAVKVKDFKISGSIFLISY